MFFKKIQPKNTLISEKIRGKNTTNFKKIQGKEEKTYISTQTGPQIGAKGNCPPALSFLLRASGPSFLLNAPPCAFTLSSLLKALKGRKKVSIPLSS
jgi:hypothetical protein